MSAPQGTRLEPAAKKTTTLMGFDATVPRYPKRFRWRVIRYILFISMLTSGVAFGYSYWRQAGFLRQDRHARGRMLSQTLAEGAELAVLSNEPALAAGPLQRLFRQKDVVFAEVYGGDKVRLVQKKSRPEWTGLEYLNILF